MARIARVRTELRRRTPDDHARQERRGGAPNDACADLMVARRDQAVAQADVRGDPTAAPTAVRRGGCI
jgi:hypothetical protein